MANATEPKQAKFHLPADLHAFLKHAAIESRRSLNAEVVFRLMESRRAQTVAQEAKQ